MANFFFVKVIITMYICLDIYKINVVTITVTIYVRIRKKNVGLKI